MAGVPHGAFAAQKVRANQWRLQLAEDGDRCDADSGPHLHHHAASAAPLPNQSVLEQPMKYNSKLMNSIWGLYNRYSVHNFKKNTDGKDMFPGEQHLHAAVSQSPLKGFLLAGRSN